MQDLMDSGGRTDVLHMRVRERKQGNWYIDGLSNTAHTFRGIGVKGVVRWGLGRQGRLDGGAGFTAALGTMLDGVGQGRAYTAWELVDLSCNAGFAQRRTYYYSAGGRWA